MVLVTLGNANTKKPLTRAMHAALARVMFGDEPDRRLAIYSYEADFSQLWGIDLPDAELLIPLDTDDVVVVIRERTNGPVTDLPEAGMYLTVRDWAVWLCLSRWNSGRKSIPSIILVDATPTSKTNSDCHADRFFHMFPGFQVSRFPISHGLKTYLCSTVPDNPVAFYKSLPLLKKDSAVPRCPKTSRWCDNFGSRSFFNLAVRQTIIRSPTS